jgi:DNA-binding NarL/FixJ family response regulator
MNLDQTNKQILKYLSEGLTSKEIAPKVYLSEARVVQRIAEMMDATNTKNRTELVFYFYEDIKQIREEQKAA